MADSRPPIDMAAFVRIVGRGPGRSRSLTREEARTAFGLILSEEADAHQTGAFLMLLRYRGETAEELAGFVDAAREGPPTLNATYLPHLDWPSYSGGRTRGVPWFLLAALALSRSGYSVFMHGAHDFSTALSPAEALPALGLRAASNLKDAEEHLAAGQFAYLALSDLSPPLDRLLKLRHLFGLRSPANTVVRLLNPLDARASIDGVFHPPYIRLHLDAARLLGRKRQMVIKGAGGEAERNPAKPCNAGLWVPHDGDDGNGSTREHEEYLFPAIPNTEVKDSSADITAMTKIWQSGGEGGIAAATIIGTISLALLAMGIASDVDAAETMAPRIWRQRHRKN